MRNPTKKQNPKTDELGFVLKRVQPRLLLVAEKNPDPHAWNIDETMKFF